MTREFDPQVGDRVIYHPVGGAMQTSTGRIMDILTHTAIAGDTGVRAKASEEHPRYVIQNDHTQKETAYKREAIVEPVEEIAAGHHPSKAPRSPRRHEGIAEMASRGRPTSDE